MALQSYTYVLCAADTEESLDHLFLHYPFARACWNLVDGNLLSTVQGLQRSVISSFFMEIVILLCWRIVRNDAIFQRVVPAVGQSKMCLPEGVCHGYPLAKTEIFSLY